MAVKTEHPVLFNPHGVNNIIVPGLNQIAGKKGHVSFLVEQEYTSKNP